MSTPCSQSGFVKSFWLVKSPTRSTLHKLSEMPGRPGVLSRKRHQEPPGTKWEKEEGDAGHMIDSRRAWDKGIFSTRSATSCNFSGFNV